jgi:hypothetical protein
MINILVSEVDAFERLAILQLAAHKSSLDYFSFDEILTTLENTLGSELVDLVTSSGVYNELVELHRSLADKESVVTRQNIAVMKEALANLFFPGAL